jgi:hypothetical protein
VGSRPAGGLGPHARRRRTPAGHDPGALHLVRGLRGDFDRPAVYTQLRSYDPGWPIEVRADFAEPKRGREDRREALAAFLHVTDYQFPDAQSPARVEFLAERAAPQPEEVPPPRPSTALPATGGGAVAGLGAAALAAAVALRERGARRDDASAQPPLSLRS